MNILKNHKDTEHIHSTLKNVSKRNHGKVQNDKLNQLLVVESSNEHSDQLPSACTNLIIGNETLDIGTRLVESRSLEFGPFKERSSEHQTIWKKKLEITIPFVTKSSVHHRDWFTKPLEQRNAMRERKLF